MRFLVFMIPAVYQPKNGKQQNPDFSADPGKTLKMMTAMGRFNDELKQAGVLRDLDGLAPLAKGARLAFAGGQPTVTDGPAVDSKEVVGGYWLVEAKTKQQVVDWWKRCPAEAGDMIEIRQVAELSDFPAEVQKALQQPAPAVAGPMADMMAGKAASKTPAAGTKVSRAISQAPGPWKKLKRSRTKEQD
jgi:hypothetical protein